MNQICKINGHQWGEWIQDEKPCRKIRKCQVEDCYRTDSKDEHNLVFDRTEEEIYTFNPESFQMVDYYVCSRTGCGYQTSENQTNGGFQK